MLFPAAWALGVPFAPHSGVGGCAKKYPALEFPGGMAVYYTRGDRQRCRARVIWEISVPINDTNMQSNEKDKKERLRQGYPWSDKELADLRAMYPYRTNRALELHFGRSWMSIRHKAQELGLKKPKNRTRKHRPWSDLEIELLRALYPDTPLEEIAAQLIGRSLGSVGGMAHILGLRRVNPWTEEEIALLRRLWPERTLSELAGILKRAPRAIKSKARRLGLRRQPMVAADSGDKGEAVAARERKSKRSAPRPWAEEEVKCLKHMYPTRSPGEIAKNLDHRSVASIKGKAWELGLAQKRAWTAEEDKLIREYYLSLSWDKIARRLGRSSCGVQLRARALGLQYKGHRAWTDREDEFLRKYWSELDAGELAEQLDRTVVAVLTRAHKLGLLDRRNWWTEQDEAFLLEHWQDKSYPWIAQQLNRPIGTVCFYAQKLGLRKQQQRSWTEQEIRILQSMHGHTEAAQIAQHLKRSVASVNAQMAKLGLTTPHPGAWTLEEKERLRTLYGRYSLKEMAEQLGRSVCAVKVKITELGLSRLVHPQ